MEKLMQETPNITTQLLAIWGALLSTLLAGIGIIKFYYEGVRIKVTVKGGFKAMPHDTVYGNKKYILIVASNGGKRTTTITHAWLMTPGKISLICSECFLRGPKKLEEGDYSQFMIAEEEVQREYGMQPRDYIAAVSDAVDRTFYSHNLLIRWFKKARMKVFTKIKD